jgi:hypothetical protein
MDIISSIRTSEISIRENDKRCAPGISFDSASCIKLSLLVELANAYNIDASNDDKIKLYTKLETLNPSKYKKYIVREIKNRVGDKCTTQKCWTEQSFINKLNKKVKIELQKYTFRPEGPNGKFEWLNTFNIDDVMSQYEVEHSDFKYLGTVPMDFDSLPRFYLSGIDYTDYYKNKKTKFGVVFNLDESWKTGSHWVAMYADMKNAEVVYFDSYGTAPDKRVRKLMRKIASDTQKINPDVSIKSDHNKIRHQYKNSECGVYSMNFIIRMLKGETFENICKSKTSDDEINKCRKKYFINT